MFHLKSFSRFPLRRRPAKSLSGFIEDNYTAILDPTAVNSKAVLLSPRRSWMAGPWHDRRISRLDSCNAGKLTAEERERLTLFEAPKFEHWQPAHGCAPNSPFSTAR